MNTQKEVTRDRKEKKTKSYMIRAIRNGNKEESFIYVLAIIMGFILDIFRIIKNLILSVIGIGIACGVIAAIILFIKLKPTYDTYNDIATRYVHDSTKDTFRISESSFIYDKDGNMIAKLRADMDSTYLNYEDIPVEVIDAFVAVEDRSFWDNPGIDIKGLIRVGVDAIKSKGEEIHGASTITQQLSRNIFLTHEVSIERKVKEMLIALKMTEKYSKRDIMEFYVNDICFANAYYGIEAASIGYFNKPASELTLSEIAYLCAIPNSPSYYDPYRHPERAVLRRDKILGDMLELNYISKDEYNEAKAQKIEIVKPEVEFNNYETTYAIDCAVRYLMKLNGFKFRYEFETMADYSNYNKDYNYEYSIAKDQLYSNGYKIYTTIDSEKQAELQQVLNDRLAFNKEVDEETGLFKLQGALTAIDNGTGKVIAIIGGRYTEGDTYSYSLNRAFQSPRQPGSCMKPIAVYAPGLENGYRPSTVIKNIDVSQATGPKVNLDTLPGEAMTLRSAVERSKNGVAWMVFSDISPTKGLSYLTNMNFAHIVPDDYYPAASLGGLTYGTTTVEMASAYATLANHGEFREPTCIDKMIDKHGKDIYYESNEKQVYTKRAADEIIDIMQGVHLRGTATGMGWSSKSKVEAAVKTGTTNDYKDGWLCGSTPYYTIAVWVGYDTPKTVKGMQGGTYPAQIWRDSMLKLLGDIKVGEFIEAEYTAEDDIVMPESYYTYLPGRDDSEILSSGYTVADYRSDRVIGEDVDRAINEMVSINRADPNAVAFVEAKRAEAQTIVDSIYSTKYTNEKQAALDATYNQVMAEIAAVINAAAAAPQQ